MDQRRIIGLVAGCAVVVTGAVVVASAWPADPPRHRALPVAEPAGPAPSAVELATAGTAAPQPRRTEAYDGPPVRARSRDIDVAADPGRRRADVPRRGTERFSMLSVTWDDPGDAPRGAVQVRTRAAGTGRWSSWQSLETTESHGPDRPAEAGAGVRGGTGAIWVGESDGVTARISGGSGTAPLPDGLRLHLIDPGAPKAGGGQGGGLLAEPSAPASGPAPAPAVPFPAYVSRAEWGADESLVGGPPAYADSVQVQFVHHTAGGNSYDCAQSAALLRGILVDHTRNRGWDDIGYNFLVDKCGTLFEGRGGGVDKAVIGAHTYGFNTLSSGVAVLGDHRTTTVPAAVRATIAHLAAAKLGQYGLDAAGTSELTEGVSDGKFPRGTVVTFPRVSGHRDGVATECPGDRLYADLPAIQGSASRTPYALTAAAPTGGARSGSTYYVKGSATLSWTIGTPSALLARFEVLVDGKVAGTLANTARAATVSPLAAGTRKLQIRAVHTLGGTATTPAATVVSDLAKPTFGKAAAVAFRGGTVSTTSVPVTVTWQAADNGKLASITTSPTKSTLSATATAWNTTARPGASTTFGISARDVAGNVAGTSATRTPVLVAETAAKRTGTWKTRSSSSLLNGKALTTSSKNAKLTWTVTGRAVALTVARGAKHGKVDVYLDGKRVSTLDLKTSANEYRRLIWTRTFPSAGKHTVQVVNLATSGRPSVTIDGFGYLR